MDEEVDDEKSDPKGYLGEGKDMQQRKKKKCRAPNGRPTKWRFWVTGTAKPTEIPAVLLQWKYNNNENSEIKTAWRVRRAPQGVHKALPFGVPPRIPIPIPKKVGGKRKCRIALAETTIKR